MDANIQALKDYIASQRSVNVDDQIIHQSLIASGWQHDAIVSAMSAPADIIASPTTAAQPVVADPKVGKKVKVIGIITMVLGGLAIISGLYAGIDVIQITFGAIEIVIGLGILKYNKVAFTFFNVLAILAILSSILLIPSVIFGILFFAYWQSVELIITMLISAVLSVGQLVFYIYSGIILHNKSVQQLFKRV
jgi:hypothetical protein